MVRWIVGSILHGYPLSYFSFQPVLHDWFNRCVPVKKSAVQATILWKETWESNGMKKLRKVLRRNVMVLRHIVSSSSEKVKDMEAAAPLVMEMP